uniref:Protein containing BFD-like [2Fe-2S]-binding region domain protein n=1 Tax=uncultured organism TaxID=155900 RepID=M1Q2B6_9ZZZZ|nr:protein containing BFD-like [2Fe-2S]-binding region domain protein [uncultured organism]
MIEVLEMEAENENQKNDYLICRCQEVTRSEIQECIDRGITTLRGIKIRTKAGMGLCQGKTCSRLITKMLIENGIKPETIEPAQVRPPLRALKIDKLIAGAEENETT